jgi:hypothetical protein
MAVKRKSAPPKVRARAPAVRRTVARKAPVKRRAAVGRAKATARRRRKVSPYQSALSMITFYLNRGGRELPKAARRVLHTAKTELRKLGRKVSRRR